MECEMSMVERRFKVLRKHLDDLGYRQPLVIDSLPLVERIIADLLHTTDSLRHYKSLAQQSLEECNQLGVGIEPYRQDNSKLVQENNDLTLKLLHSKEDADKSLKEIRAQLRKLENENADLRFVSSQHLARVKALELESAEKSRKIVKLQGRSSHAIIVTPGGKKKSIPFHRPTIEIDSPLKPGKPWQEQFWSVNAQAGDPYIASMCEVSDQRINCLWREVNLQKEKCVQQSELINTCKNQLQNRDREIERLSSMLQGGRPIAAVSNDCCFTEMRTQLVTLAEDNKKLDQKNMEMERQLKEMVSKHRDTANKAAKLSDRNRQLEQEMHDIDHMALTVEAECNSTVKENSKHVSKLKTNLDESMHKIRDLEREILELKRNSQESQAELDKLQNEKKNLQKILDTLTEDKKRVTERTNNFTVIENDLNMEIDRLTQVTNVQKLQIAELQSRIASQETQSLPTDTGPDTKKSSASREKKSSSKKSGSSKTSTGGKGSTTSLKVTLEADLGTDVNKRSEKSRPSSPDKGSSKGDKEQMILTERLQAERDLYFKEFHELKSQLCSIPSQQDRDENCSLRRKLDERSRELTESRQIIRDLSREKTSLQVCVDSNRACAPSPTEETGTTRSLMKRLEHERDLARGDVIRLEEERAAFRDRLRISTDAQVSESSRFEKLVLESEERIRRLEAERRECINGQAALRATVNSLSAELEQTKVAQGAAQQELSHQRMLYSQIKTLHEQTDRALADTQAQLSQTDSDLNRTSDQLREMGRVRGALEREVSQLKAEIISLKRALAQVDEEKDGLLIHIDEKTERVAQLEQELKGKDCKLKMMKDKMTELQIKLDALLDENACQGREASRFETEVHGLRQEICSLQRVHENSLREVRRLSDDVAAATQDSCLARRELEQSRQECENLKRQLQDYVAEVRRVEELLQQKEGERSELLDHFRSLSQEATVLETNNHSLGHEAEEAKTQLQCAEHRVTDLEMLLETKESLAQNYETQLADLTSHVACLENQLQVQCEQKSRLECDVAAVRDLCMKLDCQKAELIEANAESDAVKMHLDKELCRIRDEHDQLQDEAAKDRCSIKSLECSLACSRQETMDGRKTNQELKAEVATLRRRIDDLQERLDAESSEVRRYQQQAAEYSQHVSDLRREVTNERFERARSIEETRRASDPTCPCPRPGVVPGSARLTSAITSRAYPGSMQRPSQMPCTCPPGVGDNRISRPLTSGSILPTRFPSASRRPTSMIPCTGQRVICLCPQPPVNPSSQLTSELGSNNMKSGDGAGLTCGPDDETKSSTEVDSSDGDENASVAENEQKEKNAERRTSSTNSDDLADETRPKELYQPEPTNSGENSDMSSSGRNSDKLENETRPKEPFQSVPPNTGDTGERSPAVSNKSRNGPSNETRSKELIQSESRIWGNNAEMSSSPRNKSSDGLDFETQPLDPVRSLSRHGRKTGEMPSSPRNKSSDGLDFETQPIDPVGSPSRHGRKTGEMSSSPRNKSRGNLDEAQPKDLVQTAPSSGKSGDRSPSWNNKSRHNLGNETRSKEVVQPEPSRSGKNDGRSSPSRNGTNPDKSRSLEMVEPEPEWGSDLSPSQSDDEIALKISLQRKGDECPVEVDLLITNGQATKTISGGKGKNIQEVTNKPNRDANSKVKTVNVSQNVTVPASMNLGRSRSKSPKK